MITRVLRVHSETQQSIVVCGRAGAVYACMACMHTQPLRRLVHQHLPRSFTLSSETLYALTAQPARKHTLRLRASLKTPSNNSPRNKKRPAELQTYRGYLGDTRSKKSRYSNAAIDRVKEDHRENMRTVS